MKIKNQSYMHCKLIFWSVTVIVPNAGENYHTGVTQTAAMAAAATTMMTIKMKSIVGYGKSTF
jgi:hypothetical protein